MSPPEDLMPVSTLTPMGYPLVKKLIVDKWLKAIPAVFVIGHARRRDVESWSGQFSWQMLKLFAPPGVHDT